jgi:exodeoxyribonuclease III
VFIFVNVNGLRAFISKGGLDQLLDTHPDHDNLTICLQEIKMMGDEPEKELLRREATKETAARMINAFQFRFYNTAKEGGLHGTAIFTNSEPLQTINTIGDSTNDNEGRTLALVYSSHAVVNTYCPNAGMARQNNAKRRVYMEGLAKLLDRLEHNGPDPAVLRPLVWGGDKNAIKTDIDGHQRCLDNPGCRKEEQEEFRQQLHTTGLVDMFDYQDPKAPMPDNERLTWFFREKDQIWNRGLRLDSALGALGSPLTPGSVVASALDASGAPPFRGPIFALS